MHPYDVVVLDRDLPELHGDDVCRALERRAARDQDPDADRRAQPRRPRRRASRSAPTTTSPKPFRFAELVARVHALARRAGARAPAGAARAATSSSTPRGAPPRAPARELALSPKEFGVLEVLLAADGAVVSAEELLERVWDENVDPFTNTVRMTVMKLRRKLGEPAVDPHRPGRRLPRLMRPGLAIRAAADAPLRRRCWSPATAVLLGSSWWLLGRPPASARCRPSTPTDVLGAARRASTRSPSPAPRSWRSASAGWRPAARWRRSARSSPRLRRDLRRAARRARRARPARTTSCTSWPSPSTRCSTASRAPSRRSAASSPTPATSCARR